jgi:WxcM-like, C-terminal
MPHLINTITIRQDRGDLTMIEKVLPFQIRRVFYIYNVPPSTQRGGHAHKKNMLAMIAVNGKCLVLGDNWQFTLDSPTKCLILDPSDWHQVIYEAPNTVLLHLCSEEHDPEDYIR